MDWFQDHVVGLSAGAWTALAAWLAVLVGVAALVYASRQYRRAREEAAELTQPQVAMFMEPSASDWHLIELVVKNFGRTPAYGIRFEFANPPTVGPTWRRHRSGASSGIRRSTAANWARRSRRASTMR